MREAPAGPAIGGYDAEVTSSRAVPIALTALALALVNVALAYLIVRAAGFSVLGPPLPAALAVLAVGILAAVGAVVEWRKYLRGT